VIINTYTKTYASYLAL